MCTGTSAFCVSIQLMCWSTYLANRELEQARKWYVICDVSEDDLIKINEAINNKSAVATSMVWN